MDRRNAVPRQNLDWMCECDVGGLLKTARTCIPRTCGPYWSTAEAARCDWTRSRTERAANGCAGFAVGRRASRQHFSSKTSKALLCKICGGRHRWSTAYQRCRDAMIGFMHALDLFLLAGGFLVASCRVVWRVHVFRTAQYHLVSTLLDCLSFT